MSETRALALSCPNDHCITCGDIAVSMVVLRVDGQRGLALCAPSEPAAGARATSTVETALVEPVEAGDRLLVHAGVALVRLERAAGEVGS